MTTTSQRPPVVRSPHITGGLLVAALASTTILSLLPNPLPTSFSEILLTIVLLLSLTAVYTSPAHETRGAWLGVGVLYGLTAVPLWLLPSLAFAFDISQAARAPEAALRVRSANAAAAGAAALVYVIVSVGLGLPLIIGFALALTALLLITTTVDNGKLTALSPLDFIGVPVALVMVHLHGDVIIMQWGGWVVLGLMLALAVPRYQLGRIAERTETQVEALKLENNRLTEQARSVEKLGESVRARALRFESMQLMIQAMGAARDEIELHDALLQSVNVLFDVPVVRFVSLKQDKIVYEHARVNNRTVLQPSAPQFAYEKGAIAAAAEGMMPVITRFEPDDDRRTPAYGVLPGDAAECSVCIPLIYAGRTVGMLAAVYPEQEQLSEQDTAAMTMLGTQAAIAIENVRLLGKLRDLAENLADRVVERTAELQRQKQETAAILNNSSDGILVAYTKGNIRQTNLSFNDLFACDVDTYFNQKFTVLVDNEVDKLALRQMMQKVLITGKREHIELTMRRNDHTTFFASVGLASFMTTRGDAQEQRIVMSIRDITSLKLGERDLTAALGRERELNKLTTRLVGMMTHELKNPLAVIASSTGMLTTFGDELTEDKRDKHLRQIEKATTHIETLMTDILFYTNYQENAKYEFNPSPIDIAAFCAELIEEIHIGSGNSHTINLLDHYNKGINGDPKLLRHIIINLLSNAVKYSAPGTDVVLSLSTAPEGLLIDVTDHGIGIPEPDQANIFEAFQRARNVGKVSGTGLGLALVHRLVTQHNGSITFISSPGVGTTFSVTIPQ